MGMRLCADVGCVCGKRYVSDLPVGEGVIQPWKLAVESGELWGNDRSLPWLGKPLRDSFFHPNERHVELQTKRSKKKRNIIILNTIDFLYGHCLLKLLNVEDILKSMPDDWGVIVIAQQFLEWLIPEGISERWIVDISLEEGRDFFPSFHMQIHETLKKYDRVNVSRALPHPTKYTVSRFTGVYPHRFNEEEPYITYIWREDRTWPETEKPVRGSAAQRAEDRSIHIQSEHVQRLFGFLREQYPSFKFAVAGLGAPGGLPEYIEDWRTERFTASIERQLCQLYARSRVVVGLHGSSMLLPSGHAGFTIDLMPLKRWRNYGQDFLYQESDARRSSYRFRCLPVQITPDDLAFIINELLENWFVFEERLRLGNTSELIDTGELYKTT